MDLTGIRVDELRKQTEEGYGEFYKQLEGLTAVEQDNPDLTKPFALYSSRIRLTAHERLNVLEREVVRAYIRELGEKDKEIEIHKHETCSLLAVTEVLETEKAELAEKLYTAQHDLKQLSQSWEADKVRRDDLLAKVRADHERQKEMFHLDVEALHDIFVNELAIKDNIIS